MPGLTRPLSRTRMSPTTGPVSASSSGVFTSTALFISMSARVPTRIDDGRQRGLHDLRSLGGVDFLELRFGLVVGDEGVRQVLEHHEALGGGRLGVVLAL